MNRNGFTLAESLVALSITAIAGSALMLAVETSLNTTDESLEQTMAAGIAQQLVDEVLGTRYGSVGSGAHAWPLGPSAYEQSGYGRERFDDTDDYNSFSAQPPEDVWGGELGRGNDRVRPRDPNFQLASGRFRRWREEIDVYYVAESDHSRRLDDGMTSDYRCVEVRIYLQEADGGEREMTRLRRVYSYVVEP